MLQAQNRKSDTKFLLKFGRSSAEWLTSCRAEPSQTFGRILRPKFRVRRLEIGPPYCLLKCHLTVISLIHGACSYCMFACNRYVILDWQNGSKSLKHTQKVEQHQEPLLIWHQRGLLILSRLVRSSTMFTVLASFCGNCCQDKTHMKVMYV